MKIKKELIIIGGGLSGLCLSWLLKKKGIDTTILEASDRLGGRIHTVSGKLDTPLELGATWFSDMHPRLLSLINELGLKKYPQYTRGMSLFQTKSFEPAQKFLVPEADAPSYRIAGGTSAIIKSLSKTLSPDSVYLNTKVVAIRDLAARELVIETDRGITFIGDTVISCMPPQLVGSNIKFEPALQASVSDILPEVHTWMAGAIKFVLEYDQPFWRKSGFSGMLYSHAGIITEMYDHSNFEEDRFGLTGFLNSGSSSYPQQVRKDFVLRQLNDLMGDEIPMPTAYYDKIWNDEFIREGSTSSLLPHQNNGHAAFNLSYMDNRFHFCGTETASSFYGYMEGAVIAAEMVSERF